MVVLEELTAKYHGCVKWYGRVKDDNIQGQLASSSPSTQSNSPSHTVWWEEVRRTGGQEDRRTGGQGDRRTGGQGDRKTGVNIDMRTRRLEDRTGIHEDRMTGGEDDR